MAPVTRKSSNTGVTKQVHRKRPIRKEASSEEWDILHDNDTSDSDTHDNNANHEIHRSLPDADPIDNLRDMADRVGEEVDRFAETLDKFNDALRGPDAYVSARELCRAYKDYTEGVVKKLRKQGQVRAVEGMKSRFGGDSRAGFVFGRKSAMAETEGGGGYKEVEELRVWTAEMDTWELFGIMLELHCEPDKERKVAEKKAKLGEMDELHRYSSSEDYWQRYLLDNDTARERHLVVKWLEQAADHDQSDANALSQEWEKKSGRGAGLWMNGWMETREKIKGAKRMRLGSGSALDVPRSDNNDLLVSELDPDAPTRQSRVLEKQDAYSERTMWMVCWQMLRRGKSWAEVSEWCIERNQSWRALSMGIASDKQTDVSSNGPAAGALWRRMCSIAAKASTNDEYESAVYGLLSGDLATVEKVCRCWDDHLYVHYNSLLLAQYDDFLLGHHSLKLPDDFTRKHGIGNTTIRHSGSEATAGIQKLIRKLSADPKTAKEASSAIKLLQGSLITNDFAALCEKIGTAISDTAWRDSSSAVIRPLRKAVPSDDSKALPEAAISEDRNALRLATHMLISLRSYHGPLSQSINSDALDNIIAAYIQLLRANGKIDLAPIYASWMAPERGVSSLAQVISDSKDPEEMIAFIKLTEVYGVDAVAVLNGQYRYLLDKMLSEKTKAPIFSLLESTEDDLYPGQRVKLESPHHALTDEEEALVDSLSVFYLIDGHWTVTFEALSYSCRKLLINGHLELARALVHRIEFEQLSTAKSSSILGKPTNVMDHEQAMLMATVHDRATEIHILQKESQAYHDMTLLIRAIDALEHWRKVEHEYARRVPRPSSVPAKVKKAFEETKECVEALLGGILIESKDEEEAASFTAIRTLYMPEILIAYNTVLCTAAHMISRDELLTSMDLSTSIADEATGLAKAFVDAGRMTELVKSFAMTSQSMLKLNELGKGRKEKRGRAGMGRGLGIWEING